MGAKNLQYHNGDSFKFFYKKLNYSLRRSKNDVAKMQLFNLKKILLYSYENVPFYKKLFDQINFDPKKFNKISLINKIPTINKKTILKNYREFQNNSIKKKDKVYMTTGGSTGNPLLVPMTKEYKERSLACTFFYMDYLGFSILKDKSIRIHGDIISTKSKIYKISKNKLILSSKHINIFNLDKIIYLINWFRPKYIHAYPSAIFLLCKLLKKNKNKIKHSIEAIFTDSEVLYSYQRKEIENYFSCKVYSTYGHTEGAVLGISSKLTNFIHIQPDVGFVQLLKKNNKEISVENSLGELVVTGFLNKAFPLIRYKTGDISSYAKVNTVRNIFSYKVLKKIEGREQDYIVNKKKELIPAAPLLFDYNIDWSNVEKFQIEQKKIGKITLLIKLIDNKQKIKTLSRIEREFSKLFDNKIDTKYKIVKSIQTTKIGKFRYMNQFLKIGNLIK